MLNVEKIENGFIVRIEQDEPEWSNEGKTKQVMGTDLPPEKIWYGKDQDAVFTIMKEHYFEEA